MLDALLHSDRSARWVDRDGDTLRELVAQAERIAELLAGDGRRVVLSCRYARSFVPGLLGAWLSGATVELLPNVQPGTLDRVDADDEVAHVLHDVAAQQERSTKALYIPRVLGVSGSRPRTARPARWPDLAVRMTTSGTTERPRYVVKTTAQLLGELDVLAKVFAPARAVLSTVPLSHLYGLLFGALLPLRFGARIVSHEALLPADIAALIARESVDLMISTPAHLRAMGAMGAMPAAAMPRGLRVITSGARMPGELHVALATDHGWHVTDILGSTESGGIATRDHPMNPWTPLPGVAISAPGDQLVVASPWCDGSRLQLDDRVELRGDGTFHYMGRSHELVKIAGKRANAHAIEATVLAVPGVTDVALLVHGTAGKEPRVALAVCAALDSAGNPTVTREAIGQAIRREFDAVFAPRIVKLVPRIPRTERGKLDAETLRALLGLDADERGAPVTQIPLRAIGPGEYVADVPQDLVFFRGHFDAFAILPGAVLVDRVVWPAAKAELPAGTALRGIRRLRFRRPVFPDQQLLITIIREPSREPGREPSRVGFEVSCSGSPVASGQLLVGPR